MGVSVNVGGGREEVLGLFENLRVADVRDGMDTMMLHARGSMSPEIKPLWRTRAVGIARTARYVPYSGTVPEKSPEEYWEWVGWYYGNVCTYPWVEDIVPGDFIVIDQSGVDCGLMGSNNSLGCVKRGARGFVTSGGVRDTDELILQEVPFWSPFCSQSMVQGRLEFSDKDCTVEVGGATVRPGDVVVADGDGVIVVPSDVAAEVARWAHAEHKRDIAGRRKLYDAMGLDPDASVEQYDA
ncbi:MAG: RraA family protein [Planctomycetota bacterium]|jgi:regulator of RNase E activity RraA